MRGLIAEFESEDAVIAALRRARESGYERFEAYSPFPLLAVGDMLGRQRALVPVAALLAGLVGAAITYYVQLWTNAFDYPLNVGGRPLHSWPAFIPATIIVGLLWAVAGAMVSALALCRLPRLHHPLFDVPGFERASEDRFFLAIGSDDRKFRPTATRRFLEALGARRVVEIPG